MLGNVWFRVEGFRFEFRDAYARAKAQGLGLRLWVCSPGFGLKFSRFVLVLKALRGPRVFRTQGLWSLRVWLRVEGGLGLQVLRVSLPGLRDWLAAVASYANSLIYKPPFLKGLHIRMHAIILTTGGVLWISGPRAGDQVRFRGPCM